MLAGSGRSSRRPARARERWRSTTGTFSSGGDRASPTVEAADWLATRAAADRIIVAGDCGASIASIAERLRDHGHQVEALRGGEMRHDDDRTEHDLERFCGELLTLTACRWAYSNAPASTVLVASRALGNEVWTSDDVKGERIDNGYHLFSRFGFDLLTC